LNDKPHINILSAHRGNDTGGTGWRIAQAFRSPPQDGWVFRSACNPAAVLPYLDYPQDVEWDWEEVRRLHAEADLFHARNDWSTYDKLGSSLPAVIHYHGTNFRILNAQRLREQREHGAIGLVSTLDLWLIRPESLEWLPSPYDLEWLDSLRTA
jgi:hypothetical protein